MSNFFTEYNSVQAPPIVTPETKQLELKFNQYESDDSEEETDNSNDLNWDFLETKVQKPQTNSQNDSDDSSVSNLINNARQFIGSKYSWGGSSPSTGFDCSGLISYLFKQQGINLPRTAAAQGKVGQEVDISQTKPGDVIWFGSKSSPSGQHIGLVSKIENGQIYIIDAAGKAKGVVERALPNLQIKSIRRLFGTLPSSNFGNSVINFFTNKGLSVNQARGILGNLMQESRGNSNITNKRSGAFGIAQWLGSRKQKLKSRYGNNPTLQQQLEFIWEELNTTEGKAMRELTNSRTVSDATRAFANHFERAGKSEMNMNQRINFAYNS